MGPYERVLGSGQALTLEPNRGRRRGANGSSKRGLPSWRRSACKPPGSEKRPAFWRGDTGLFRGARRCGLSGARSLLPGVLERLTLGLTSPSTQPLLPGRAGAPDSRARQTKRSPPPPRACWSAADKLEPSSRGPPSGAAGACAARVGRMWGLAECGGVRKARTMVADSRGYVPGFHSP